MSVIQEFKHRLRGFLDAFNGIRLMVAEFHFKVHLIIVLLVHVLGFLLNISSIEWCLVWLAIGLVLMAEGLNTAIEYMVDFMAPDYEEKAGRIKDIASGAVTLAAIASAVIGAIIFLPKLLGVVFG